MPVALETKQVVLDPFLLSFETQLLFQYSENVQT